MARRNDNDLMMGLVEDLSSGDRHVVRDDAGFVLDVVTFGHDQLRGMKNKTMAVRCAVIGGDRRGAAATLGYVR